MNQRKQHHQIHLRVYQETEPELYQWYKNLSSLANKSRQVKAVLRAGLQAQRGEQPLTTAQRASPPATAAVDTAELLAALLPEIRAVVSAALATARIAPAKTTEPAEETPEMQEFMANLDASLFLED